MTNKEIEELISFAINGDNKALEMVLVEVQDFIFNLSLRMLGTIADAEDATQDILIKIMTNLSSFRKESNFNTWVYRIASNYLLDYKKSMFSKYPLDFDYYANDIKAGYTEPVDELVTDVSQEDLAAELKLSCTNVMLQCLDAQSRCIFILGTMFKVDSKIASEILHMTPENYRQKLSRSRKKMAKFLREYCGLSGTGCCSCHHRVGYAMKQRRLHPRHLEYTKLKELDQAILEDFTESMEVLDDKVPVFEELPKYASSMDIKKYIQNLVTSAHMAKIKSY